MTVDQETDQEKTPLRFTLSELAGSFGDYGTIIPLVLAMAVISDLDISYIFLFFGIWFAISGMYYRLPIPVEPMKAVAVTIIAGAFTAGEITAAGLILGVIFLVLGFGTVMAILERWIPRSVIRGIQLGLAFLLVRSSATFVLADPTFFILGVVIIIAFFFLARRFAVPDISALIVIAIAVGIGIIEFGFPGFHLIGPPHLIIPGIGDYSVALTDLVLPQIGLTIANAILATALLSLDLFSRETAPKYLSRTIGLMNLISVPFGGVPMCHGAGGYAAQYRFGARTGGANILAGVIFVTFALFFASPEILTLISSGFYGALLVFVAIELARYGLKTDSYPVTLLIAVLALVFGMTVGFLVGLAVAYFLPWVEKRYRGRKELPESGKDEKSLFQRSGKDEKSI
jgi:MFS superfamily sulfate permease-like transporter